MRGSCSSPACGDLDNKYIEKNGGKRVSNQGLRNSHYTLHKGTI